MTVAGKAKTAIICGLGKIVRQGAGARSAGPRAYFFSGRNQFITSAQMPPVATPDSRTLFT